ncbi:fumarylacetoacetate hydrolase family protein [Maritalea porphyrae]|nr:fumarylacetoacetate hydrolase family protein [Maritalea porphyrae]MCZ4272809.1 fumarylacetoacetate hydrolase family protein [Maritalea porphyrae]
MNRFVSYTINGTPMWGATDGQNITDLSPQMTQFGTLRDVFHANAQNQALELAQKLGHSRDIADAKLDIPLPNPGKIICVGVNFPARNEEYKDGQDAPPNMSLFVRFPSSFTGHNSPLIRPKASHQLDYEGEIAIVIGKGGRHISQAESLDHIAALTICNEGTIRDWVRHAKFNVTQGKNFDNSGAMGPWLVPYSDPQQIENADIVTRVNDEVRQKDNTSRMLFPIRKQIEYISTFTTLEPGDIIVTGTPTGAGARLDPPQFLQPGDKVEVEVSGIGTLINGIEDEQ